MSNANPPLPIIGNPLWGDQLNGVLLDLQTRVSTLEGGTPPPEPSGQARYRLTAKNSPPSGSGELCFLGNQAAADPIWISLTDADGTDRTAALKGLDAAWVLRFTDEADGSRWQDYYLVGPVVVTAPYATINGAVHWNAGNQLTIPSDVLMTVTAPG